MGKHTPGPWVIEECKGAQSNFGIRKRGLSKGSSIAGFVAFVNTRWPGPEQQVEMVANLHLITAAPDLHRAAVEANAALAGCLEVMGDVANVGYAKQLLEVALEKARGGAV